MDIEKNRRIVWRLPVRIATAMDGNWDPFRDLLARWAETAPPLDPSLDATKAVGFPVPESTMLALDTEAARLTELTDQKWTAGRVARLIWDAYE